MLSSSLKLSLISYALASWHEGTAGLRHLALSNIPSTSSSTHSQSSASGRRTRGRSFAGGDRREDDRQEEEEMSVGEKVKKWIMSPGDELDSRTRAILSSLDFLTSIGLLNYFDTSYPLSIIFTALAGSLPLPRRLPRVASVNWGVVAGAMIVLAVSHEVQRVSVGFLISRAREEKEGERIIVCGDPIPTSESTTSSSSSTKDVTSTEEGGEAEERECSICSGASTDRLGSEKLESFCVTAPRMHLSHRSCFLAWHEAYLQQRRRGASQLDIVLVSSSPPPSNPSSSPPSNPTSSPSSTPFSTSLSTSASASVNEVEGGEVRDDKLLERARSILDATGFQYLNLASGSALAHAAVRNLFGAVGVDEDTFPSMILNPSSTLPSSSSSSSSSSSTSTSTPAIDVGTPIASLRTTTPPCPVCRSPVLFKFYSSPPSSHSSTFSSSSSASSSLLEDPIRWLHLYAHFISHKSGGLKVLRRVVVQIGYLGVLLFVRWSRRKMKISMSTNIGMGVRGANASANGMGMNARGLTVGGGR
ncbi:hypothetical protein SISNIDRAFT_491918 [Sistotremastrum niveocremeum HHB9708]|uniref:RING-CH-type domain-containing protein n=1 Tax=Sistotremastrum niveocremeum HHB9708 TaxID=1314777 RepID=A0A164M8V1_9AGAM|nr:hypothetical protein SISNIDRAFT_491918 [Sistotremastrum niveocremeum HHB9708]